MVLVKRDVEKASGRVGRADAANAGAGNGDGVLDIEGICGEVVRQGQDFIGIVGIGRWIVGTGGGEVPGGDTELVQVECSGGLDVKFICRGFGEAAGAYQIAVDEVIELAVGDGDAYGNPLAFVAVVSKICSN